MKHKFWGREGRYPAKKEVGKELKNDNRGKTTYSTRLGIFKRQEYGQMVSSGDITPYRKSPNKLQEWSFELPQNRTARMLFIVYQGCAWFLLFFVKKSKKGIKMPPKYRAMAELRAEECWEMLRKK